MVLAAAGISSPLSLIHFPAKILPKDPLDSSLSLTNFVTSLNKLNRTFIHYYVIGIMAKYLTVFNVELIDR